MIPLKNKLYNCMCRPDYNHKHSSKRLIISKM